MWCWRGRRRSAGVHEHSLERYMRDLLRHNRWGNAHGRTLFVTNEYRHELFTALEGEGMGREARALEVWDVDVKDLLEMGRVVVEKDALEAMLKDHEEDLGTEEKLHAFRKGERRGVRKAKRREELREVLGEQKEAAAVAAA